MNDGESQFDDFHLMLVIKLFFKYQIFKKLKFVCFYEYKNINLEQLEFKLFYLVFQLNTHEIGILNQKYYFPKYVLINLIAINDNIIIYCTKQYGMRSVRDTIRAKKLANPVRFKHFMQLKPTAYTENQNEVNF